MAIQAVCSECGRKYTLADQLQGRKVKCKQCRAEFVVGGAAAGSVLTPEIVDDDVVPGEAVDDKVMLKKGDTTPVRKHEGNETEAVRATAGAAPPLRKSARRQNDDEGDEARPRRRSRTEADDDEDGDDRGERRRRRRDRDAGGKGALIGVLVGGGVALVLIGVVLFFLLRSSSDAPPVPVAQGPQDQGPLQVPPIQPPPIQPKIEVPKFQPPPPPPKNDTPKVAFWKAQPDPGPDMNAAPAVPNLTVLLSGNGHVVLPSTPSPLVAIKHGNFTKERWEVYDLQQGKQVHTVADPLRDMREEVLSPDGKYLAGKGRGKPGVEEIMVFSLAETKFAPSISIDTRLAGLRLFDFVDKGHLLTYQHKGGDSHFEIFNLATGQAVKSFQRKGHPDVKHNLAFSPGRKYLLIAHERKIELYHAVDGAKLGDMEFPELDGNFRAAAFSHDGQEFACLVEHLGGAQLLSFKTASGELAIRHRFAREIGSLVAHAFFYRGPIMEWLPDKSGWLMYGQAWIDYPSGALAYTVNVDKSDLSGRPRRLIGKDHLATVGKAGAQAALGLAALPKDEIATAVKNARAGGGAVAELPPTKNADLAAAKTLPAPAGNVAWNVVPDPAPAARAPLAAQPIALRARVDTIQHILFSSASAGHAVLLTSAAPNALSAKKIVQAERYDLTSGKLLDSLALFMDDPAKKPVFGQPQAPLRGNVSPDGTRLAANEPGNAQRLDVWSLADGKHLAGWQPYANTALEWFAFLSSDRLLTADTNGKLILWKVPECQAVYVADGYRGPFHLSPNRKYLVGLNPVGTLELIEAATGERRGQLASPGAPVLTVMAAAFSSDGKKFAATVNLQTFKMCRWDLSTGAFEGSMDHNGGNQPMQWAGERHVLQGTTLYDWSFKGPLWHYTFPGSPGLHATDSPDGRHWFAYTLQNTPVLSVQRLPDTQAQALSAQIAGGQAQPVVRPGMAFQVNVSGDGRFTAEVQNALTANLKASGYKIGGGGLTISVTGQGSNTGKQLQYDIRRIGFGKGPLFQKVTINELAVKCSYVITDAQGAELAKQEQTFRTPFSITFKGQNYQQELDDATWNSAILFGRSIPIPTNLYRIQGVLTVLPRTGPLTPGS